MAIRVVDSHAISYGARMVLLRAGHTVVQAGPKDGEICRTCGKQRYLTSELLPHMLKTFWTDRSGEPHQCKRRIGPICESTNCMRPVGSTGVTMYGPGYLVVICADCAAEWEQRDSKGFRAAVSDARRFRYAEG